MSKPHNITIIAGLSGVGKTYVIERILANDDQFIHFSAGSLIKKRLAVVDRDHLRLLSANQVLQNQYALVEQFNIEMASVPKGSHVLFDAHMIIDIGTEVIEIPFDIFEKLIPSRMVLLCEDPETIIKRRNLDSSRDRPVRAAIEIKKQQDLSRKFAAELSDHLSIPFVTASTQDISELKARIT